MSVKRIHKTKGILKITGGFGWARE